MSAISYSQARLFSECPAKFKAERIDGIKPEASLPMKQGSFVHAVTEAYSNRLRDIGKEQDVDLALNIAEDLWAVGAYSLPEIVKEDCFRLVREVAQNVLIRKAVIVGVECPVALDYRGRLVPFEDQSAVVRGRLDRLEIDNGVLTVWDLKAGRVIDNPAESVQLALYVALGRAISPDIEEFVGKLYFPRHNVERVAKITAGRADAALKWVLGIGAKIKEAKASGVFHETPGAGCSDCPLFWSCEARKRLAVPGDIRVPETEDAAATMVLRAEVLSRELSELRELLKLWVDRNGSIQVGGVVADIGIVNRIKWKIPQLRAFLELQCNEPYFMKYVKGDTTKLKRLAVKYPIFAERMSEFSENKSGTKLNIRRFGSEASSAFGEEAE